MPAVKPRMDNHSPFTSPHQAPPIEPSTEPPQSFVYRNVEVAARAGPSSLANLASQQQEQYDTIDSIIPSTHLNRSLDRAPIPKNVRVNSNHRLTYDPRPPSQQQPKRKHRFREFCKRLYVFFRSKVHKLKRRSKRERNSDGDGDGDEYTRTICVVFEDANGKEFLRHAKARFDTGNPRNLISPAFAAKFGFIFESSDGEVILELPGGGRYVSIARLRGRWSCKVDDHSHERRFFFDPKFMDAEFEVSNTTERFDIVIGADTIREEKLFVWRPDLGLTGFRTKPPTFKPAEIEAAETKQMKDRAENEAWKKALLANKVQSPPIKQDSEARRDQNSTQT